MNTYILQKLTIILSLIAWKMEVITPYSPMHIWVVAQVSVFLLMAVLIINKQKWDTTKSIFSIGVILFFMELVKQVFLTYVRGWNYSWSDFPFQLCSVPMYLCVLYPFLKGKGKQTVEDFLSVFGLLGGIAAFAEPTSSFTHYWVLTMHSITWHVLLILVAVLILLQKKSYNHSFWNVGILYLVTAGIAVFLNYIFGDLSRGTMNLFFLGPSYPDMIILNDIYRRMGWLVETGCMIGGTELVGYIFFRIQKRIYKNIVKK